MKMVDRLRSYKNDVHSEFFMEVADHIEKQERMIKLMKMDIDRNKHNPNPFASALNALLACPFCGSTEGNGLLVDESEQGYWVECENVFCMVQPCLCTYFGSKEEAIAEWNKRPVLYRAG